MATWSISRVPSRSSSMKRSSCARPRPFQGTESSISFHEGRHFGVRGRELSSRLDRTAGANRFAERRPSGRGLREFSRAGRASQGRHSFRQRGTQVPVSSEGDCDGAAPARHSVLARPGFSRCAASPGALLLPGAREAHRFSDQPCGERVLPHVLNGRSVLAQARRGRSVRSSPRDHRPSRSRCALLA